VENRLRVAVIQDAPVVLDREKTLRKAIHLIEEAGNNRAKLIVFPEAFVPYYPRGLTFGCVVGSRTEEGRREYEEYYNQSVEIPSLFTDEIGRAAKQTGTYVVMGVTEKEKRTGTLYCSVIFWGPEGELLGKHRKLKPTGTERVIWGEGDQTTLTTVDTPYGIMGSLICWENYMPLARAYLYQQGVTIYIAPTADQREVYQNTLKHIGLEGRCFVISANQYIEKKDLPVHLQNHKEITPQPEILSRGGSAIVNPMGEYVVKPLYDQRGILYGDLDLSMVVRSRLDFDPAGHYHRPDVFQLSIPKKD